MSDSKSRITSTQPETLLRFSQELLSIVRAGIPLDQGLVAAAESFEKGKFSRALVRVEASIEQGKSLSEALRKAGDVFPESYANLIFTGEKMGSLTEALEFLIVDYQRQVRWRRAILYAAAYPMCIFTLSVGIASLLLVIVGPHFRNMFEEIAPDKLPYITRFVLGISSVLGRYWPLPLAVALGLGVYGWRFFSNSRAVLRDWPLLKHLPLFSVLYRNQLCLTFFSTMGSLMRRGVPVPAALGFARTALIGRSARAELDRARLQLERGRDLADALQSLSFLPPPARSILRTAAKRPDLDEVMIELGKHYDRQIDQIESVVLRILPQAAILFVGPIIGGIVISFYMPLFKMIENI